MQPGNPASGHRTARAEFRRRGRDESVSTPMAVLGKVGYFMLVVSAVGLIVGSTVTERPRIGMRLQERTSYLNPLIEIAHLES